MTLNDHIAAIEAAVGDARQGLPEPVFLMLGRMTAAVNVDLLIRDERGATILAWRDDHLFRGWHVPGGVVRFKEAMAHRVAEVARLELGATVSMQPAPLAVNELIDPARADRGHFISFLFDCSLTSALDETRHYRGDGAPKDGEWAWHASYPSDMIAFHAIYRGLIGPQR